MDKEKIANICENLYKYCLNKIPQIENNKLIWILNGSTLCNILCNVSFIDGNKVSDEFKKYSYRFVRVPKGDIDITYVADREYKFDLSARQVLEFKEISEENRTYNFVDSNSELMDMDLKQVCKMTTKNGFSFYAKKPQYLFLYKLKEFLDLYNVEIISGDIESINLKNKNIVRDVSILYDIAINYINKDELFDLINNIFTISNYLKDLKEFDINAYYKLINACLSIITNKEKNNEFIKI